MNVIPLAGVIGHPIGHSKSPRLHGHWLRAYGLPGHYIPIDVAPDDLADILETLPKMGFRGVNVTVPHKERALALAGKASARALRIGAANTLTFREGRIEADNTDGIGFIENLKQAGWQADDRPAAILGAGGAARAVVVSLLEEGLPEILISNRTRARAEALKQEFGARLRVVDWARADAMLAEAGTVVNTTSLGMQGNAPLPFTFEHLREDATVTDLVYAPLRTEILRVAATKGCKTVDGLGMLLHQGVPGFERWFGQRPQVDQALRDAVLG